MAKKVRCPVCDRDYWNDLPFCIHCVEARLRESTEKAFKELDESKRQTFVASKTYMLD